MSDCLLFYFTKIFYPISFLILFFHSLSAIWTDLLVLTLALFIFLHSHFHYSLIFISLTAFLFYGLTSTVSLNKLSYSCSVFCWHFKSSSFTLLFHFTSSRIISFYFFISFVFMRKLPLPTSARIGPTIWGGIFVVFSRS